MSQGRWASWRLFAEAPLMARFRFGRRRRLLNFFLQESLFGVLMTGVCTPVAEPLARPDPIGIPREKTKSVGVVRAIPLLMILMIPIHVHPDARLIQPGPGHVCALAERSARALPWRDAAREPTERRGARAHRAPLARAPWSLPWLPVALREGKREGRWGALRSRCGYGA